jgi:hypothetical protein
MTLPIPSLDGPASPEICARVLGALEKSSVTTLCAACGALAGGVSLTEARRAIADLASAGKLSLTIDGVCGVCGRRQDVMSR